MSDDHYQILGVSRTATSEDIQKAYREMARKYHPDLHPDDDAAKEQFKKVQTAFDVLNDPSKREMYDRYGSSFEGVNAGGGGWSPQGHQGGFQAGGEVDLESLFGGGFADLFGGGKRRSSRPRRSASTQGEDITANIRIPFQLAIDGGKTEVRFDRDGHSETLSITIPQGLPDGARMRLRGQGRPGSGGGAAGDLLLEVGVEPHPVYRREGDTLAVNLPISLSEALEGAKVDLPTPWGVISLRLPAGTSSGKKLRAAGMGVRHTNGSKGDLIAEVQIVLPDLKNEAESKSLLDAVKAAELSSPKDPRAAIKW
ncbi:MAG: J domain-containing protein [Planctomycetota bacterium]|nr:J domain-containing protein [Pirellulales bacterium]MDA7992215.1 J domain-containing protein [Pirellulales bacterium]MEC8737918.1 J domain-containing protein [Planctomycetota bacterium]